MQALSKTLTTLAVTLALAATAQAQIALNAANGVNGTPAIGDAPGWPITIAVPGHYWLTSNLILDGSSTAIHIVTPGVTLDLNGHTIRGPASCSVQNGQVSCASVVNQNTWGILSASDHTVIRNGRVRGFGAGGIQVKSGIVENVQVESNSGPGIQIGVSPGLQASRVSGVTATLNNFAGVFTRNALIERAVLSKNAYGVSGYRYSLLDSLVVDNTIGGVWDNAPNPAHHAAIRGTVLHSNTGPSIIGTVHSLGGNLVDGVAY